MQNALKYYDQIKLLEVKFSSTENLDFRFQELANTLLNETLILIAGVSFRLTEIEFYGYSTAHKDPFTHQAKEQKQFGQWYFHKIGNSYKGGSFKGLDLTLGDGHNYLGVLIRGIKSTEDEFSIEGPSLVVDKILNLTSSESIANLMLKLTPEMLKLVHTKSLEIKELVTCPRVGLSSTKIEDALFLFSPYRYLSNSNDTKKGKALMYLYQYNFYGSTTALTKVKISSKIAEKYQTWFDNGRNERLESLIQSPASNVQSLCELFGSWCLYRCQQSVK